MLLRCHWSYNRDILKNFKTLFIIETVLTFIVFLELPSYWCYNRNILKKKTFICAWMSKFIQNYKKVSLEYLKSFKHRNYSWKKLNGRETVLIIKRVLIFIILLKLHLYWSNNRDISKKIQTLLIIETWEYLCICTLWDHQ